MAKKANHTGEKVVDPDRVAQALAKAVHDGDFVNFKTVFAPFSPARKSSTEYFESEKYSYLLPREELESEVRYQDALALVRKDAVWAHVLQELEAERPAQLPWELALLLADNAVREEKYSSAAQAYELLRIRRRMQELFFERADVALETGDVLAAVRGYVIATGLAYDYAAFPEPLPLVLNFQTRALMIHGEYPTRPEDCVALQDEEAHTNAALEFLLGDVEAAARLRPLALATRTAFLKELVRLRDPQWDDFVARYREASDMAREYGERLQREGAAPRRGPETLEEEIEEQMGDDPLAITAHLLGRELADGEWWQYLKEIAYEHPPGILFISRQAVGEDEILIPRYQSEGSVARAIGLIEGTGAEEVAG